MNREDLVDIFYMHLINTCNGEECLTMKRVEKACGEHNSKFEMKVAA